MNLFCLITLIGSFAFFTFDDDENASANQEGPSNDYLSKRDVKAIAVAFAVLIAVGIPGYFLMRSQLNVYLCRENMQSISVSMSNYMIDNDDKAPPAFAADPNTGLPALDAQGLPSVWASTLVNISGFDPKRSFMCPSSSESEAVWVEGANGKKMAMTYGLYAPIAMHSKSDFADAGSVVMVTETVNGGVDGTFDPHPIRPGGPGGSIMDGYLIGFASGDQMPKEKDISGTQITRLAFPDSSGGISGDSSSNRHSGDIMALFLDGHYGLINGKAAASNDLWHLPMYGKTGL